MPHQAAQPCSRDYALATHCFQPGWCSQSSFNARHAPLAHWLSLQQPEPVGSLRPVGMQCPLVARTFILQKNSYGESAL